MFEAGLFESRHELRTKTRWTLMASVIVQGGLMAVLIALPLLHPAMLHMDAAKPITAPMFSQPRPVPQMSRSSASSGVSVPAMVEIATNTRPMIHDPFARDADLPPAVTIGPMMQGESPFGTAIGESGPAVGGPGEAKRGPVRVSRGVMEGRLLAPITPEYPRIAIAMHAEGKVVVEARISAAGTIEDAHVVSGPVVLQNAALDAVKRARYEPYKLSGQAVDVETTIQIIFSLENN